jgi:ABC-type multidrug transport system ATPase subunit
MSDGVVDNHDTNILDVLEEGVSLRLKEFSIGIKGTGKYIVHPLSITVPGATLFAIMGGSGSGKTTLLNVLAGRYSGASYEMDESRITFSRRQCNVGYVTQSDFLLPHLTVKETLLFTAQLKIAPTKLPDLLSHRDEDSLRTVSAAEVGELYDLVVDDVINDLGLSNQSNSLIGDDGNATGKRGLSGGEKRRVSVALQILTDPEVLCADEPTSGLDSFTAVVVMEKLKQLTTRKKRQITVICSIHQPRADVFDLFDGVLILTKGGEAVYCGHTRAMVSYFSNKGYPCPTDANPADYCIDQSSMEKNNALSVQRVQFLVDQFKLEQHTALNDELQQATFEPLTSFKLHLDNEQINEIGWFRQCALLMRRFGVNNTRDTSHIMGGLIQSLCLGFMVMGIFWQLGNSVQDVSSRSGLIYINVSMEQYILLVILVERYSRDLKIFDRELQDRLYHPSAYFVAHWLTSFPSLLFQSMVYSTAIYFGTNLRPGWSHVLEFYTVNFILTLVINGLTWMCLSVSRDFALASLIGNMNFTFISLTAGFLVNYNSMPVYVGWVRHISFLSYAYRILMNNEFLDRTIGNCPDSNSAACDGNQILVAYGVTPNAIDGPWGALLAIGVGYYLVAAVMLTILRFSPNSTVVNSHEEEAEETTLATHLTITNNIIVDETKPAAALSGTDIEVGVHVNDGIDI